MFDMLKNLIGAFCYRFWSKLMPRHSRKPKKNKKLKPVPPPSQDTVGRCWEAYERLVMLGAISLGLLQLISLNVTNGLKVYQNHRKKVYHLQRRSISIHKERVGFSV
jgi:hypothetical protein